MAPRENHQYNHDETQCMTRCSLAQPDHLRARALIDFIISRLMIIALARRWSGCARLDEMHEYPKITKCGVSSDNILLQKDKRNCQKVGMARKKFFLKSSVQSRASGPSWASHHHQQMPSLHRIIFVRPPSSRHNH